MEIIDDLADLFDSFMIDLTNIGAGDKQSPDKALLISQFEALLSNKALANQASVDQSSAQQQLNNLVPESTNIQYHNGL